jgi:hypothetical protein
MAAAVILQGMLYNFITVDDEEFLICFHEANGEYWATLVVSNTEYHLMKLNKESYIKQKEGLAKNDVGWNKRYVAFLRNAQ